MRKAVAHVPRKQHSMVAAVIHAAFEQKNQRKAHQQWRETGDKLRERCVKVAEFMDSAEDNVLAFMGSRRRTGRSWHQRTYWSG